MPYLGMNVPICPLCVFSLQLGPIRGKKKKIRGDNFPVPSSL